MRLRQLSLHTAAKQDLLEIWRLVDRNDGPQRADALLARIEVFVRSLAEFAEIGRRHDERKPGLRSCGVPGLKRVTVLFEVTDQTVLVVRIGYLGRNISAADDVSAL